MSRKKKKGISRKTKNRLRLLWGIILIETVILVILVMFAKINSMLRGTLIGTGEVTESEEPEDEIASCILTSVEKVGEQEMRVTYDAVTNAVGYEVSYRADGGEWITELTADTKFIFGTEAGVEYEIRVRAYGNAGQYGAYSQTVSANMDAVAPILKLESSNLLQLDFSWTESRRDDTYRVAYRKTGETGWSTVDTAEREIRIGNLEPNTTYEVMVTELTDGEAGLSSDTVEYVTEGSEYADPFLGLYATLTVGTEKKGVCYSDSDGCLGAKVWPEFNTKLYEKADRTGKSTDVSGGELFTVVRDKDGNYVCRLSENNWSLYVTGTSGGNAVSGWIQASAVLIDLQDLFPGSSTYSIHYDRTNAYSSIFTAGGNGMRIDSDSDSETRWEPLNADTGKESLSVGGYNVIAGVTGNKLPNYGSRDQMPVVWDVARELITCQKNALERGMCLLIYESYRPNSTSKAVYQAVTNNAYLRTTKNGHTLANGFFITANYGESNYIANNSKHNKGIALDLTIMSYVSTEELGSEVTMQTKMHTLDFRCNMSFNNENANLLSTIMMTDTGLVPLKGKQEWWHFELDTDESRYPCINQYTFTDYEI